MPTREEQAKKGNDIMDGIIVLVVAMIVPGLVGIGIGMFIGWRWM